MLNDIASAIGKGLLAGLIGTAAMTLSSTLEMKLRGRQADDTPSKAAGKVLGVQPRNPQGKARFGSIVHWGYGTAWGGVRGLAALTGLPSPAAGLIHFAAVWGAAQLMLPSLDVSPPISEWSAEEVATDIFHHAVYAAATGAAYDFIERH
jgi:hypothetical protein